MCEACASRSSDTTIAKVTGVSFHVPDMTCGHCAGTIGSALSKALPGEGFEIDLANHRVTVSGDGKLAEQAIRNAGYNPHVLGA